MSHIDESPVADLSARNKSAFMKASVLAVLLAFSIPAFSQSPSASEASIRELLAVTDARNLVEGLWGQIEDLMEKAMKDAVGDKPVSAKPVSAKQEEIMAEMRKESVALLREEMSWEKLEPMYIRMYAQTFTQAELDGMIEFYKSDAGRAMTAKMPKLTQVVMQDVMQIMQGVTPKLRALTEKHVARLKAATN